jgi:hypothetical protein
MKGVQVSASEDSDTRVVGKQKQVYIPKFSIVDCLHDTDEVTIEYHRTGRTIIAYACFYSKAPNGDVTYYKGAGYSIRNPEDREREDLGEALAAARALNKLAGLIYKDIMEKVHVRCNGKNHLAKFSDDELLEKQDEVRKELMGRNSRRKHNAMVRSQKREEQAIKHIQEETGIVSEVEVTHGRKRA